MKLCVSYMEQNKNRLSGKPKRLRFIAASYVTSMPCGIWMTGTGDLLAILAATYCEGAHTSCRNWKPSA
ncbi:hypothetical protein D3C71_2109500 [compost metagenome]